MFVLLIPVGAPIIVANESMKTLPPVADKSNKVSSK